MSLMARRRSWRRCDRTVAYPALPVQVHGRPKIVHDTKSTYLPSPYIGGGCAGPWVGRGAETGVSMP